MYLLESNIRYDNANMYMHVYMHAHLHCIYMSNMVVGNAYLSLYTLKCAYLCNPLSNEVVLESCREVCSAIL